MTDKTPKSVWIWPCAPTVTDPKWWGYARARRGDISNSDDEDNAVEYVRADTVAAFKDDP